MFYTMMMNDVHFGKIAPILGLFRGGLLFMLLVMLLISISYGQSILRSPGKLLSLTSSDRVISY